MIFVEYRMRVEYLYQEERSWSTSDIWCKEQSGKPDAPQLSMEYILLPSWKETLSKVYQLEKMCLDIFFVSRTCSWIALENWLILRTIHHEEKNALGVPYSAIPAEKDATFLNIV